MAAKKAVKKGGPPSSRVGAVRVTNPEKLLYPESGITKREVAGYFEAVAPWMLAHVVGRPVTFVRYQHGWDKGGFYQKHAKGGVAKGVRTVAVGAHAKGGDVLAIDDASTLVGLAQMNVLEVHVWGAKIAALDRPDLLLFDLDPDPEVPWSEVLATARVVRERLAARGHEAFVKTTGGKGLHLACRAPAGMTWRQAHDLGRDLGEELVREAPERWLTSISKAKRKGKTLLDFSRNVPQSTFVAPYSPRGRAGAPVSTPLAWDELDASAPADLTIRTVVDRLRARGDPWAALA